MGYRIPEFEAFKGTEMDAILSDMHGEGDTEAEALAQLRAKMRSAGFIRAC